MSIADTDAPMSASADAGMPTAAAAAADATTSTAAAESITATATAAASNAASASIANAAPGTAAPATASSVPSCSSILTELPASLQVSRLLKSRVLLDRVQYRVRWEGLSTETWLDRSKLFWRGEAAIRQLEEFEEAVAKGIITAEGGWEEAEQAAAAASVAAKVA